MTWFRGVILLFFLFGLRHSVDSFRNQCHTSLVLPYQPDILRLCRLRGGQSSDSDLESDIKSIIAEGQRSFATELPKPRSVFPGVVENAEAESSETLEQMKEKVETACTTE